MNVRINPSRTLVGICLLAALVASGCAKPPVSEIASAEAALQAAKEAEAPKYATDLYNDAEGAMTETYRLRDAKQYPEAKTRALETRDLAEQARDLALERAAEGGNGDGDQMGDRNAEQARADVESEEIGAGAFDVGSRIKSLKPVYFEFDDYSIRDDQRKRVEAAAEWLDKRPSISVRLEGHTDERGAADYNMVLGERRAESVRKLLTSLGIERGRLSVQSFGEEMPADPGHDKDAWAQNRRVEFVVSATDDE